MDYLNDSIAMMMLDYEGGLEKSTNHLKNEFTLVRAGRINTAIVERVVVDYYGTPTPLKNLCTNISCVNNTTLAINLWDTAAIREASKALTAANLGVNPIDDGKIIRMIFPQLTQDRRKELVKQVKKMCEEAKVAMRNLRRDAMDKLKKISKEEKVSEDESSLVEKEIQRILDGYIASCDKLLDVKEKEIMEI